MLTASRTPATTSFRSSTTAVHRGPERPVRVAIREEYIRSAYADADEKLGVARGLMGGNPTTFAGSDHGFAPAVLRRQREQGPERDDWSAACRSTRATPMPRTAGRSAVCRAPRRRPASRRRHHQGLLGRRDDPDLHQPGRLKSTAQPTFPTYAEVRTAIRKAFENLTDPANPGKQVVLRIMNKEELRNVDGSDSLHPNRSGDVVVVTAAAVPVGRRHAGQAIALSHFFGQHGYLPNTVDLANNINMHAMFVMAGPGVKHKDKSTDLRAVDIAPTLVVPDGHPGAAERARRDPLRPDQGAPRSSSEVTILDVSDWHAQLTPLAEAADTAPATRRRSRSAARRSSRPGSTSTRPKPRRAGDNSAGVIESWPRRLVRRDPTDLELLRRQADAPDHEHDGHRYRRHRQPQLRPRRRYLRNTLIPLAQFPIVSSNVVFPNGQTPAEWSQSTFQLRSAA